MEEKKKLFTVQALKIPWQLAIDLLSRKAPFSRGEMHILKTNHRIH